MVGPLRGIAGKKLPGLSKSNIVASRYKDHFYRVVPTTRLHCIYRTFTGSCFFKKLPTLIKNSFATFTVYKVGNCCFWSERKLLALWLLKFHREKLGSKINNKTRVLNFLKMVTDRRLRRSLLWRPFHSHPRWLRSEKLRQSSIPHGSGEQRFRWSVVPEKTRRNLSMRFQRDCYANDFKNAFYMYSFQYFGLWRNLYLSLKHRISFFSNLWPQYSALPQVKKIKI